MRENFEYGLQQLRNQITQMGDLVDKALRQSIESLRLRQTILAQHVITQDAEINRARFAIEEEALTMIATQGPVAHDLRLIAATMYIATELERMGDHAKGIARITNLLGDSEPVKPLVDIPKMSDRSRQMLQEALQAFVKLDANAAQRVAAMDDELDDLYNRIYLDLLEIMGKDPNTVQRATYLLWVAHNLERYGDRIVNICERIVFVATGEMVEIRGHLNG